VLTGLVVDTPHPFRPRYALQRGFQAWEVIRGQENDEWKPGPKDEDLPFPCDPAKLRGGRSGAMAQHLKNNLHRRSESDYLCARTMITAAQWLEANRRQPFFLYVDTFDPHEPWDPPANYVDLYDPGYKGERVLYPRYTYTDYLTEAELRHCRACYAAECSLVDRWVGHLLATVESLGLEQNTAVFFTTDHGFYLGEHGIIGKGLIADAGFQTLPLWSEVSHIPFLARLPGQNASRRLKGLVQPGDLMPTVLDLLQVPVPKTVRTQSIQPLLDGQRDQVHDFVISSPCIYRPGMEQPSVARRSSVTDGRWMLIYGAQRAGAAQSADTTVMVDNERRGEQWLERTPPRIELYDLDADPGCTRNVLDAHRDEARRLHRGYLEFLRRENIPESHLQHYATLP
jgi:arylsulfatase A-like enzyme